MEKVTIYLHSYVYEALRQFGTLDEVLDKILQANEQGLIDIYYKPSCPPADVSCSRYSINITNKKYISDRAKFGNNSAMLSIRRLLYWFVDNEVYLDLNWQCVNYHNKETTKALRLIDKAYNNMLDALQLLQNDTDRYNKLLVYCQSMENLINEMQ